MPRKPKHLQKSKEETTAENYFPVDESNLKRTVEKDVKRVDFGDLQKIEVQGKKLKVPRKRAKKSPKRKISKKVEFSPEDIELKKNGYELIITEKPQAALKIASALGKSIKRNVGNVPYYEVNRQGKELVVACSVGHLFTLRQKNPGQEIP